MPSFHSVNHFTLPQLLLACLLSGLLVSILLTSTFSHWNLTVTEKMNPGEYQHHIRERMGIRQEQQLSEPYIGNGNVGGKIRTFQTQISEMTQQPQPTPTSSLSPVISSPTPITTTTSPITTSVQSAPSSTIMPQPGTAIDNLLNDYIKLHKAILAREPGVEQKFIVARPQAQLNNRLRVIVGGLVLGMLTKRAFLIDFTSGYYASLSDVFSLPIEMDLHKFDQSRIGAGQSMTMEDIDKLLCIDYNKAFTMPSIDLGTPPNLIPFFWRNPHHSETLKSWFGFEEQIYQTVAREFLAPSQTVQSMIDRFKMKHEWSLSPSASTSTYLVPSSSSPSLTPSRVRIGVHLRWGPDHRPQPVRDDEWEDMVHCVRAVIPKHLQTAPSTSSLAQSLDIFVAADTDESRQRAQIELSRLMPHARILSYETWQRSNSPGGVQAAYAELLLLSSCDHLVLSPASSYSEQAQVLHGKPGYWIRSTVPNPARIQFSVTHEISKNCLRPYSIQPSIEYFSKTIQKAACYHPDMHAISF